MPIFNDTITIKGSTSGSVVIAAPAAAGSTTLTTPGATDTLVGRASTDTLTNKTLTDPVLTADSGGTTPGKIWQDSTQQCTASANGSGTGNKVYHGGLLFAATANAASTTTAQTVSMVPTGIGSMTLKANSMVVGKTYRLTLLGFLATGVTPGNFTWAIKIGSTQIAATAAFAPVGNLSNRSFYLEFTFTVRAVGSSTSANVIGQGYFDQIASSPSITRTQIMMTAVSSGFDSTADQLVDVTLTTASNTNTITTTTCMLEVMG